MGCPFGLVLKFGGPITFDSSSGVSSLVHSCFLGFLGILLVDQRL